MKYCLLLCLLCILCTAPALADPLDNLRFANADEPVALTTCYGSEQIVHPKVLYLPDGFGGHTWWMAYTPYAWGSSAQENPCIAYSDDGYDWVNIPGNPIDLPEHGVNGYLSDTHLLYRDGILECWYRLADRSLMREVIYRKTSQDGIHWSERQLLHDTGATGAHLSCLSPCAIWNGHEYEIWYVVGNGSEPDKDQQYIQYCTSTDGTDWQPRHRIALTYRDVYRRTYRLWHIDVLQDDGATIITAMCKGGLNSLDGTSAQNWSIFAASSTDNVNYTDPMLILAGRRRAWDHYMYRACLVKADGTYRLYYSALNDKRAHYLGISVGKWDLKQPVHRTIVH